VAGGRGGRADNKRGNICAPERLLAAAAAFGRQAHVPTLWLYADNDSYFPPSWSQRMYDAFRGAGAPAAYHLLPGFGAEGHNFIESADALPLWAPMVDGFLARHP
jgi:dienelactone hydrolase